MSAHRKKQSRSTRQGTKSNPEDDFEAVARRLGADEDKATFEAKLKKIAKAVTPKTKNENG